LDDEYQLVIEIKHQCYYTIVFINM